LHLLIITSVVYNLWSKQGKVSRFSAELSLAISIGFLCYFGVSTQTTTLSLQSALLSLTLALLLLLLNSVPSGLKDIKTDESFKVESFVIASGCQMVGDDGIFIPKKVWWFAFSLQFIIVLSFVILGSLYRPSTLVIISIGVLLLLSTLHLRSILAISSFKALQRSSPILNGFYNYMALCAFVFLWMPTFIKLVYVVLTTIVLLLPLRLAYHMLRHRYFLIKPRQ